MRVVEPSVTLEWVTGNSEQRIERAARTCYRSSSCDKPEDTEAFIRRIAVQQGHESVVEHASASFRIVCDRGVSHEIVRHRLASYSQESTRYCNYSKDKFGREISVVKPVGVGECAEKCYERSARDVVAGKDPGRICEACGAYSSWKMAMENAERSYVALLAWGATPQVARSVLPTCLKTELVMTANFREWMHFLRLRTAKNAHPDMRVVAGMIGQQLAAHCPSLFGQYGEQSCAK